MSRGDFTRGRGDELADSEFHMTIPSDRVAVFLASDTCHGIMLGDSRQRLLHVVAEPQVLRICEEAHNLMVESRWSDLVSLLLTSADLIFSNSPEKDLDCIFAVICNLVTRAESPDEALAMAEHIATKVCHQPTDKSALRLRILFNLYNMLDHPYSKFLVYRRALKLAVNGKVADLIMPSFKKMDTFLREWNLGTNDQRDLFLSVSNILKDNKGSAKDSYSFLLKYLATFTNEDAYTLSEAKEEAVRAVIEFVKAPDVFQDNIANVVRTVQNAKASGEIPQALQGVAH